MCILANLCITATLALCLPFRFPQGEAEAEAEARYWRLGGEWSGVFIFLAPSLVLFLQWAVFGSETQGCPALSTTLPQFQWPPFPLVPSGLGTVMAPLLLWATVLCSELCMGPIAEHSSIPGVTRPSVHCSALVNLPGSFLGVLWNWSPHRGQGEKGRKRENYWRLVGDQFNKQGNLLVRLVLGGCSHK